MADAVPVRPLDDFRLVAAAALSGGELIQLPDGRAAYRKGLKASAAGDLVSLDPSTRPLRLTKATGFEALAGGRAYWDHSANAVSYKKVNDRDFYIGRFAEDAGSADTECLVTQGIDPAYDIDLINGGAALQVATGTVAAGGFGIQPRHGSAMALLLTATNEAQCIDALSVDRFDKASNFIAEYIVRIAANGSNNTVDLSLGVANSTSTTDADAIAESAFFHIDGGSTDILVESDDGTTEVAATDSTIDFTAGSAVANRIEFWIDGRDPSNLRYFINGSEVNAATANLGNIAAATGPLGLLIHLEKSSGTATAGPVYIDAARVRLMEQ